ILLRAVDDYLTRTAHEALVRKAAKEQTAKWAELLERLR
ncbi:CopG family transcriptional regulator, partial [Streptomyces sp. C1-2]|nr:CopG family transcriptional regulator [Streptomyces sp. C1-2]